MVHGWMCIHFRLCLKPAAVCVCWFIYLKDVFSCSMHLLVFPFRLYYMKFADASFCPQWAVNRNSNSLLLPDKIAFVNEI